MLGPVTISEALSRFILQKGWYRPSDNCVKYAAFLPNPKNGETSVFRISDISEKEIWNMGDQEVASRLSKPILGSADLEASNVMRKGLRVLPSEPPDRHANIIGWPGEKSKQKLMAIEMAAETHFYKKHNGPHMPPIT